VSGFRDYVYAARQLGWFNDLEKLGVVASDCTPEFLPELQSPLAEIGYTKDKVDVYDLGCPASADAYEAASEQAVLKFKNDGVTHVLSAGVAMQYFATAADKQLYYPHYATSDVDNTLFTSDVA